MAKRYIGCYVSNNFFKKFKYCCDVNGIAPSACIKKLMELIVEENEVRLNELGFITREKESASGR